MMQSNRVVSRVLVIRKIGYEKQKQSKTTFVYSSHMILLQGHIMYMAMVINSNRVALLYSRIVDNKVQ